MLWGGQSVESAREGHEGGNVLFDARRHGAMGIRGGIMGDAYALLLNAGQTKACRRNASSGSEGGALPSRMLQRRCHRMVRARTPLEISSNFLTFVQARQLSIYNPPQ